MSIFDFHKTNYPTSWGDFSLEYKFFFVYFVAMGLMPLLSRRISASLELLAAASLLLAFTVLSIRRRRAIAWRWLGIDSKELLGAGLTAVLMGYFLYALVTSFSPFNPVFLPLFLAASGFFLFSVLQDLKVVTFSEADFLASCAKSAGSSVLVSSEANVVEASWKSAVRTIFTIAFILVWVNGISRFRFFSVRIGAIAFAVLMVCGFVIHFLLGVRLLPNYPTLQEMRGKDRRR